MRKYELFNGVAKAKLPAVERFVHLCGRRWGFTNMGTLNVRLMRSAPKGTAPNDPKWMSIHATGRALDTGWKSVKDGKAKAVEAIAWFTRPDVVDTLGILEVHDYNGVSKKGTEKYGRGWRIGRGWKDWDAKNNGGFGDGWIHVELASDIANLPADELERLWRSLPKPGQA